VDKTGAIRVAVLGAGNVGGGVARILAEKSDIYARQLGRPVELAGALVRDTSRERPFDVALQTTDANALIEDPDIDIIVETIGGEQPAHDYIARALENGKYVVTANKELMAKHGPRLLALAREHGVDLLYEASVGGGIPIIAPLKRDLLANRVLSLSAIINGTTNYILTSMSRDGADFSDALKAAQDLGYAEPDPTNDIEGEDARYKLAILASLAFHTSIHPDDIYREGITKLTAKDFRYAAELGYTIKLLALAKSSDNGIQLSVYPALIDLDAPLAKVDGVLNAVQIEGDLTGKVLFQGRGAGSFPTTSAIIADVLDAAQSIIGGRREAYVAEATSGNVLPMSELKTRFYILVSVADQPGVLAQIAFALGEANISIASVIQKETNQDARTAELVIMTHEAHEASMQQALQAVRALPPIREIGGFLRVEE
jgi:homoserine dehydrogenase